MKRLLGALCATLLTMAALVGEAAEQPAVIRIGAPDLSAGPKPFFSGPLGLAYLRGQLEKTFAADGIKIEWHFFKGAGPAVNEALANDQLDFAGLGDLAAIIGRASGLDTRLLAGGRGSNSFLAVTPESDIHQLADLHGKRVGVFRGTADQLAFARALESSGLSERDVRVVSLDWSAARAALAARQIDATWGGMGLLAARSQGIEIPVSTKQMPLTATTQTGLIGRQAFIERYPAATQKLVDEYVKNAAWISDPAHQAEYVRLMAEQSTIPAGLFESEMADTNPAFRYSPRLDPFLRSSFQDSVERAASLRLIRRTFKVEDWFDPRFVDAAVQRLGLEQRWPYYAADGQAL